MKAGDVVWVRHPISGRPAAAEYIGPSRVSGVHLVKPIARCGPDADALWAAGEVHELRDQCDARLRPHAAAKEAAAAEPKAQQMEMFG